MYNMFYYLNHILLYFTIYIFIIMLYHLKIIFKNFLGISHFPFSFSGGGGCQ